MPDVFDAGSVDIVSIPADGATVDLHIVQDQPWSGSDEQINSLQQKINNYAAYAIDGPLVEAYPEANGLRGGS